MSGTTILITGASSGIGAALARRYASPGVTLVLWGRNEGRLAETAGRCRALGAGVETACFDLAEIDELVRRLAESDDRAPFDLVIFNAGLGGSLRPGQVAQDAVSATRMAQVNFTAPIVASNLITARMALRGGGRIVLIGSIAESFPLPMAPTYAGTKAGLARFAEAMELRLARFGVGVTLVSPGFVDTPMSRGLTEPKPFLIDADKAAALIADGIARGRKRIVVPWQFAVIRAIAMLLPHAALGFLLARRWSVSRPD